MDKENTNQLKELKEDNEQLSRKIVISSDINEEVASKVIQQIIYINEHDDKMYEQQGEKYKSYPIEIYINSRGGTVHDGFAIIGAMEMSSTPIVTYGLGIVASMALGIFMAGDYRFASPYTRFMYHTTSYGITGSIQDHKEVYEEAEILENMYNDLFKDTKLTKEKMEEIKVKKLDFYFSSKEAVELGIANDILSKPTRGVIIEKLDSND